MTSPGAGVVAHRDLQIGPLLAEGGEGRVYELVDRRGVLLKAYRRPLAAAPLAGLVAWPAEVRAQRPELAERVAASSAWPSAVVVDRSSDEATARGLLLPRAPRRFSLRHRDGDVRLATLSYLTAAPGQRAAAYGLALPPAFSPERLGLVYALARLLEAFQTASPAIGHGDLSTKNVLWSLERGPEVFVLDCDSAERYDPDGVAVDAGHRRRAMTPNWDDPAIPPGSNPTPQSDGYSLALIFLRVVGAAHFPIQGRQRSGEPLHVDLGVPPTALRARSLDAQAAIWDLCDRGLGVAHPDERPSASAWAGALEEVLDDLGAMRIVRSVWAAQGGGTPAAAPPRSLGDGGRRDVTVRPVPVAVRTEPWRKVRPVAAPTTGGGLRGAGVPGPPGVAGPPSFATMPGRRGLPGRPGVAAGAGGTRGPGGLGAAGASASAVATDVAPRMRAQVSAGLRRAAAAWLRLHRRMLRSLATPGSRAIGVARLLACAALDLVLLLWGFFVVGVFFGAFLKL
jgi:hypothetical protein